MKLPRYLLVMLKDKNDKRSKAMLLKPTKDDVKGLGFHSHKGWIHNEKTYPT